MALIIQKFGGTSMATKESRQCVLDKIEKAIQRGDTPVVAVSAMGRKGAPYATDTLLSLVHNDKGEDMSANIDLLLSCGEIISAVILAEEAKERGFSPVVLTGGQAGIITNDHFSKATIIDFAPEKIQAHLAQNQLVIVAGFQGCTKDGRITTLGRGGSDTSASALAVELDADLVEIYTDVEGVMTADPRVVAEAEVLKVITYNELCNMANNGAKVVHPRAVELVKEKEIPLRVCSTFSDAPGTLVVAKKSGELMEERLISGVVGMSDIIQVQIDIAQDAAQTVIADALKALAAENISLDFINIYPKHAIFTISEKDWAKTDEVLKKEPVCYRFVQKCAKVAIVGANITGVPGVMAKIMQALLEEGIELLQTSDSYITIWCLVKEEEKDRAIQILHRVFN